MLTKISSNIHERFKKYTESPVFQQGVKDFREGNIKKITIKPVWVKKFVQVKEWNDYYKYDSSYCFLRKEERKGVWIGFAIANEIPQNCELCTDEELMQIDDYRSAKNIHPRPLKEIKKEEI